MEQEVRRPLPPAHLELDSRFSHSTEGVGLPVCLLHLLPHDHVEARAVLVAKDEASVVIVCDSVHMKRAFEVHAIESSVTWGSGKPMGLWTPQNRPLQSPAWPVGPDSPLSTPTPSLSSESRHSHAPEPWTGLSHPALAQTQPDLALSLPLSISLQSLSPPSASPTARPGSLFIVCTISIP